MNRKLFTKNEKQYHNFANHPETLIKEIDKKLDKVKNSEIKKQDSDIYRLVVIDQLKKYINKQLVSIHSNEEKNLFDTVINDADYEFLLELYINSFNQMYEYLKFEIFNPNRIDEAIENGINKHLQEHPD